MLVKYCANLLTDSDVRWDTWHVTS